MVVSRIPLKLTSTRAAVAYLHKHTCDVELANIGGIAILRGWWLPTPVCSLWCRLRNVTPVASGGVEALPSQSDSFTAKTPSQRRPAPVRPPGAPRGRSRRAPCAARDAHGCFSCVAARGTLVGRPASCLRGAAAQSFCRSCSEAHRSKVWTSHALVVTRFLRFPRQPTSAPC